MKIYIVMGSTGEYSNRYEFPVRAYKSEEKAKKCVVRLDRNIRKLFRTKHNFKTLQEEVKFRQEQKKYNDDETYFINETELKD